MFEQPCLIADHQTDRRTATWRLWMGGRMTRTLIRNGVIVPMAGRSNAIDGKSLLIDGDRIAVIEDTAVLEPQGGIDETIDATGKAWPAPARH